MACRGARKKQAQVKIPELEIVQPPVKEAVPVDTKPKEKERLFFGVDSTVMSTDVLQNNLSQFEWVVRNKVYPNFWGRNLIGENALTKEEVVFLHRKGCKIAPIYSAMGEKKTEEQGKILAKHADFCARELGIASGTVIFFEIPESDIVTQEFMYGFANMCLKEGFVPGFRANTDAKFDFDREFSRGMQTDKSVFEKCLIWAVSPSLAEYERVTTTHFIHPDHWIPFAPSAITRKDISIWQYGKSCHPIEDDAGTETTFNVNLVRNEQILIDKMF